MKTIQLISTFFCASLAFFQVQAQSLMHVQFKDQTAQSFEISDIRNITFPKNLLILKKDGTNAIMDLKGIRKITFNSVTGLSETEVKDGSFVLYPNPLENSQLSIQFSNLHLPAGTIEILTMDGLVLWKQKLDPKTSTVVLDMPNHSWPNGMYLCRIQTENKHKTQTFIINR